MSWMRCAAFAVAAALIVVAVPAPASAADSEYVKYYTVTSSFQGKPETLAGIAERFLGDGSRSAEVFNLNSGRMQPDKEALTDPARLDPGWMLVMPWDATGAGVQYGILPAKAPTPAPSPDGNDDQSTGQDTAPARPGVVPAKPPKDANPPRAGECTTAAASANRSDWAGKRLAVAQAWKQSRGLGQLIAVVDSGVDGTLAQLRGRVAVGADVTGGSGRGDTDCLGTGTAMAGLIAAQPAKGSDVSGLAPEATVMPVRVAGRKPGATPGAGAEAIAAAAAAGATVVAIGSYLDLSAPEVARAVNDAVEKGVVVVAAASLGSVPVNPAAKIGQGVLWVGGVGVDNQAADDYRKGGIDVVAPGVNVTSIGIGDGKPVGGSGSHYAVAFAAGEAALVRASYPHLKPEQVVNRVRKTAENIGGGAVPSGEFGYGMISPAGSVTAVLPEEAQEETGHKAVSIGEAQSPGNQVTLLVIVVLVAVAASVLLVFRIRQMLREGAADDDLGWPSEENPPGPGGDPDPSWEPVPGPSVPGLGPSENDGIASDEKAGAASSEKAGAAKE